MSPVSSRIGRYEIQSRIGRGGMGDLYLARDTNPLTPRLVVVKLLNTNLDSGDLRNRFAREARALAALSHPNIVRIFDAGEFEGSPFIVMEYIRGETLAEKIKRRAPMTMAQKLKVMVELCQGLAHAHEIGIIHRDIKPANLMLDLEGALKILDFGIARVAETSMTRAGAQLTQFNMRIGTPGYMSPEQIEGEETDQRSDIFAVGAVCYELLSYREAFGGATTRQIEAAVLKAQPTALVSLVPGLDPGIQEIVSRALEKDPAKRYQDAAMLREAFERQRRRLGLSDAPVAPTRVSHPEAAPKSPDSRANAAYQRARAAYEQHAEETAVRFLKESLAEDPGHREARTLLVRLEPGALPPVPVAPAPATIVVPADDTVVVTPVVPPGPGPAPPRPSRWKAEVLRWKHYGRAAQVGTILVLAAIAVAAVIVAVKMALPSGAVLTVTRPEGGTISGPGIRCGTLGSDCSATVAEGDTVELEIQPDAGFVFSGYTGDCAPSGRTLMFKARTCGARFERPPEGPPPPPARPLTIQLPKGGTVLGVGIRCGTLGSDCTEGIPAGQPVTLHVIADQGFRFQRFTGDCSPEGDVRMDEARTCGAVFEPGGTTTIRTTTVRSTTVPPTTTAPGPPPTVLGGTGTTGSTTEFTTSSVPATTTLESPYDPDKAIKEIEEVLTAYCDALTRLDLDALRRVYPGAPFNEVREQFKQYRSLECTWTTDSKRTAFNPEAGTAVVARRRRLVVDSRVGGQQTSETTVTILLSRPGPRSGWRIDAIRFPQR